jgi:hypothetical protein
MRDAAASAASGSKTSTGIRSRKTELNLMLPHCKRIGPLCLCPNVMLDLAYSERRTIKSDLRLFGVCRVVRASNPARMLNQLYCNRFER